ncbi:tigger transposable element-derived protein 4-like [Euwallacea similis]|uniref:tigger transposable element-derived protein 4-like n=1 Tax=Euwallacea similis TaxID=1736056 RepID=UPI00344ED3CB
MAKSVKRAFTLHEKLTIINDIEKGLSQSFVCSKMGLKKSTVSNIWKNRDKIKNDWKTNDQKKKMRLPLHSRVDEILFKWFQQKRANNFPISGPMLQMKAEEFGKMIGDDFKCSSGWLDRFKKRHNIVFGKICGESASVDKNITDEGLVRVWPLISNDYTEENIFNADETGIFYKMLPNKTHKLKGKFQNPRCFKNINSLPIDYYWNDKAWMTSSIFTDYFKKWDQELLKEKTKIFWLVDNCPAHPDVKLHNIKLFFPPNVTSVLQPMDQGVILNLKQIYRKQTLMKLLETQDNINIKSVTILDAINLLSLAWDEVSTQTISNCFRHSGLSKTISSNMEFDPEGDIPLAQLIRENRFMNSVNFDDFDKNVVVREQLADTDLVNQELQEETTEDIEDGDTEGETVVTTKEALNCVHTLQQYFLQQEDSNEFFSKLYKIELHLQKIYIKKIFIQRKITDFLEK